VVDGGELFGRKLLGLRIVGGLDGLVEFLVGVNEISDVLLEGGAGWRTKDFFDASFGFWSAGEAEDGGKHGFGFLGWEVEENEVEAKVGLGSVGGAGNEGDEDFFSFGGGILGIAEAGVERLEGGDEILEVQLAAIAHEAKEFDGASCF